jgi:hypothetical protein
MGEHMNKIVEKIRDKAEQIVSVTKAAGKGKHVASMQHFYDVFTELPEVQKKEVSYLRSRFVLYTLHEDDIFMKMLERSDRHVLEIDVVEKGDVLTRYRSYEAKKGEQKIHIPESFVDRIGTS